MPEVLTELVLHLKDIVHTDVCFIFEALIDNCKISLLEVFFCCLDSPRIQLHSILLLLPGLGGLSENSQKCFGLFLVNQPVTVINFLELSMDFTRLNLEKDDEEEELSEGDLAVIISIDTVQY